MHARILKTSKSQVIIGVDFLPQVLSSQVKKSQPIALICDQNVEQIAGHTLKNNLLKLGHQTHLFSFPPGESSKTRETKNNLEDQLLLAGLNKDALIVALGGGVTTDLAGYIAATYCRGVRFISIPTTLMAMVDAAIGGKNGVNTPQGKNLIGSFYFPETIFIDFKMLESLSLRELHNGWVEMIKIALLFEADFFSTLLPGFEKTNAENLHSMITRAIELKEQIVKKDQDETLGLRRSLNFGHTVAHALESYFNYEISHGEAVAKGIIAESFMAKRLNLLSQNDFHQISLTLAPYGFRQKFDLKQVVEKMQTDKKALLKSPRFVMLEKIGSVYAANGEYCLQVASEIVLDALKLINELT